MLNDASVYPIGVGPRCNLGNRWRKYADMEIMSRPWAFADLAPHTPCCNAGLMFDCEPRGSEGIFRSTVFDVVE